MKQQCTTHLPPPNGPWMVERRVVWHANKKHDNTNCWHPNPFPSTSLSIFLASIRCWDFNSKLIDHESSSMTTKPVAYVISSMTKWQDYLFNIWLFTTMSKLALFVKVVSNFCKILNKHSTNFAKDFKI